MFCRLAMPADEDEIVAMGAADVVETMPDFSFDEERFRELVHGGITEARVTVNVVEHDGALLGFSIAAIGSFYYTRALFVLVEVIYVRPERRGSRAAMLLGREFIRWGLQDVKAKRLFAGNMNGFESERTARFWEHLGFRRVGIQLLMNGVEQ